MKITGRWIDEERAVFVRWDWWLGIELSGEQMNYPYYFPWKNKFSKQCMTYTKWPALYGKRFRVIARGSKNSALVEFEDGQREVISRNAIRIRKVIEHGNTL